MGSKRILAIHELENRKNEQILDVLPNNLLMHHEAKCPECAHLCLMYS